MEAISQGFKFILFIVLYIPLNVILMISITFLFRLINHYFKLNFSLAVLSLASALLVFVILYALISFNKSGEYDYFLYSSIAINFAIVGVIVFSNYIFKNNTPIQPFIFAKPQLIATGIYIGITICFALLPTINTARSVFSDFNDEKYKSKVLEIIQSNDVEGFKKELENPTFLDSFKANYKNISLIEYLVSQDKTMLVDIAYQKKHDLKAYPYNFDIKSPEMVDVLAKNGLEASSIILPLIRANKNDFARYYVNKHKPMFDENSDIIVKVLIQKNDNTMLAFFTKNGLMISD